MQIGKKTRTLYKKLLHYISPHVFIYLVSNDTIFLSSFLKNFKLNIPHSIIKYKDAKSFLKETFIQKPNKKNIAIILSEYRFESHEDFNGLNGIDMFEIIKHTLPDSYVILLAKKNEIEEIKNSTDNIEITLKNTNTHIRVQNSIYAIYNYQNISVQKELNILLIKSFAVLFIILLAFFIFF